MPDNERTKIKKSLNSATGHISDSLKFLDRVFVKYAPPDMVQEDIIKLVMDLNIYCQQHEIDNPMVAYRVLRRDSLVPDIGRYDEHLFHLTTIYISTKAIYDALNQFKLWESRI